MQLKFSYVAAIVAATLSCGDLDPAPTRLEFDVQPVNTIAGQTIAPAIAVKVVDASGAIVPTATNAITLGIAGGGAPATLGGTVTANAVAGIATFSNLSVTTASEIEYTLTAESPGLTSASSDLFTIAPSAPVGLAFVPIQAAIHGGVPVPSLSVTVVDVFGNVTPSFIPVTLALGGNPGGATLVGTVSHFTTNGRAVFENVRVDQPGVGYTLVASSSELPSVTSNAFDVQLIWAGISAGGSHLPDKSSGHTCAVTVAGAGYCWGANSFGQLGDGTTTDRARPTLVGELSWSHISAGGHHSCGLTAPTGPLSVRNVYCWGRNSHGQAAQLDTDVSHPQPAFVMQAGASSALTGTTVSAGDLHTCIASGFNALCWGLNSSGQLGDGTTIDRKAPTLVQGDFRPFIGISADSSHTCGTYRDTGQLYCWGSNDGGKIGNGLGGSSSTPLPLPTERRFSAVAVGAAHTCADDSSTGALYCWGRGDNSQIGDGTTEQRLSQTQVTMPASAHGLTAGWYHNCAITGDPVGGPVYCWGSNANNQLGDGTNIDRATPVPIGAGLVFRRVDAGRYHTCGVTPTGVAYCWGSNNFGQLGDGTTTQRSTPTRAIQ